MNDVNNDFVREQQIAVEQRNFLYQVYLFMGGALGLTGLTAWLVSANDGLVAALYQTFVIGHYPVLLIGLAIGLIFYVGFIAKRALEMPLATVLLHMVLYSVLNGVVLSSIFMIYTSGSIMGTFLIASALFFGMSVYGYTTQTDLSKWGNILMMGLFGIIIASVVNLFLGSSFMQWLISLIGVVVFTGLTAYDSQKLKEINVIGNEGTDEDKKEALLGALILYLDFINLFLMLLRLFGSRR